MILRKPYLFFIKMFKPIHLLLSVLVFYLVSISNKILIFLNNYIYSNEGVVKKDVIESLISKAFYIIPIVMIVLFLILLSVMYKKGKPVVFYLIGIFSFIVILVINTYSINFLEHLAKNIVSVKSVKLIHDLILINMIIESCCLLFLFVRGMGIDFKKFNFSSDIAKFEISDSDKEEIEISVNIDFNERKRKRKEKIRNFKYLYAENKLIINIFVVAFLVLLSVEIVYFTNKYNSVNKENVYYSTDSFIFKVNSTTLLNTDFRGNKITENYLLVVNVSLKSKYSNEKLYLSDFGLRIENYLFKPVKKYSDKLMDLGNLYQEETLDTEYSDYIFVFEIPEKYISSEMMFRYSSEGNIISVLLNPKTIDYKQDIIQTKKLLEPLNFEGLLSGIEFNINSYELKNSFLIKYNYCITDNDCILSKEYLKPTIDKNYDKVVLKMVVEYKNNGDLDVKSFYSLLSKFGTISYLVDNTWFNIFEFEEIVSTRVAAKKNVYVGVNSNILSAESIKIVFDIRGEQYEYILK